MLLSIALLPLVAPRFWRQRYPLVSAAWALAFAVPFLAWLGRVASHELAHVVMLDFVPFLILLGTLFTISGGIHLRGTLRATPLVNLAILAAGALAASWVGTTGAAMLFIRPLLRANRDRRYRAHTVVFFIFLVANIGGAVTPLGDPPLFLGFLHGVPFLWTLGLWKEALLTAGLVLALYLAVELLHWRREDDIVRGNPEPAVGRLWVEGWHNLAFLVGAIAAVAVSGTWNPGEIDVIGVHMGIAGLLRDGVLVSMAVASWFTTRREVHQANDFTWEPIREVGILFAGIFATMVPALAMLRAGGDGALGGLIAAVRTPAQFFWATGLLSSFLDNAPTYMTFLSGALGGLFPALPEREAILRLVAEHGAHLKAIALGAVFMGANTYIGNAPNFMVRAVAEEAGVAMPSFFGYMLRYSLPILLPVFLVVTRVFFWS
jgi:Na+/H+ antiporter NhaD/arsenite permease-like protein